MVLRLLVNIWPISFRRMLFPLLRNLAYQYAYWTWFRSSVSAPYPFSSRNCSQFSIEHTNQLREGPWPTARNILFGALFEASSLRMVRSWSLLCQMYCYTFCIQTTILKEIFQSLRIWKERGIKWPNHDSHHRRIVDRHFPCTLARHVLLLTIESFMLLRTWPIWMFTDEQMW